MTDILVLNQGMVSAPSLKSVAAIAQRLKATRIALDLRPSEFADRAGIARNTYSQWEKGHGRPELDKAIQLCDAYKLTLDWIYLGDASGLPARLTDKIPPQIRVSG